MTKFRLFCNVLKQKTEKGKMIFQLNNVTFKKKQYI